MDADTLRRHAEVEGHVREGTRHTRDQRLRIAWLEAMGYDASGSRQFLDTLLTTQALHEEYRDQLRGLCWASNSPIYPGVVILHSAR
jgi:gluconate kinase